MTGNGKQKKITNSDWYEKFQILKNYIQKWC